MRDNKKKKLFETVREDGTKIEFSVMTIDGEFSAEIRDPKEGKIVNTLRGFNLAKLEAEVEEATSAPLDGYRAVIVLDRYGESSFAFMRGGDRTTMLCAEIEKDGTVKVKRGKFNPYSSKIVADYTPELAKKIAIAHDRVKKILGEASDLYGEFFTAEKVNDLDKVNFRLLLAERWASISAQTEPHDENDRR